MSAGENLHYAARYYGMGPRETRVKIPAILTKVGFPIDRRSEPMENLARDAAEGRARAGAADLAGAPAPRRADHGSRPASKLEVQNFVREVRQTHDATILLCTRPRRGGGPGRPSASSTSGELLFLETVPEILERFGVETLEQAFFAATGREFEAEMDEDDETGGVRA